MPFNVGPSELTILLVLFAILWIGWIAFRMSSGRKPPSTPQPDPRAVLAERLARGEITRDEFDTAMRALGFSDLPR